MKPRPRHVFRPRVETLENRTLLTVGALDLTFGADGKLVTPIGMGDDYGQSMVLQPDGKFVVAGYSFNGFNNDFAVIRYNADGMLDTSFDGDGKVTTSFGSGDDKAYGIALQADGRIIVAGKSSDGTGNVFAIARYNADGSLDTTFDGDGKLTTAFGSTDDGVSGVTVQADGKIVVAGYSYNGSNRDFALARYNANGSLDTFFDGDGKLTTPFGSADDVAYSVAVQADGKIVAAGYSWNGSNYVFALARYNADGSIDASFDADGKVTTPIGSADDEANDVAIQVDGKIVLAGYSYNGSTYDFALARYNADGSLDTSFDGDGRLTTPIGSSDDYAQSVAIQADGKIVAAGYLFSASTYDFALARYNADGSLDASFDGDGKLTTSIGSSHDFAYSVAIQADGKIVAAGKSINATNNDFAVVRYNADGSLDRLADGTGKVTTEFGAGDDEALAIATQNDGKLIVVGYAQVNIDPPLLEFAVARYNPDGSLDPSFDGNGTLTSNFGFAVASCVAIQNDGKIVVAGWAYVAGRVDFTLIRYNTDGSLDTSFDGDGIVTTELGSSDALPHAMAIQGDGRIVVVGECFNGVDYDFGVARYNTDGSRDTSFDGDGKLTTDVGGFSDKAFGVAVQADGKIIVAGSTDTGSGTDFAVVRYNPNGTMDSSFNGDGKLNTGFGSDTEIASGVAVQANGKIVVAGSSGGSLGDFLVARYTADGSLDSTFEQDGWLRTNFSSFDDTATGVALQGDGKIVVAGYYFTGSRYDIAIARYNADGSPDMTFDGDGRLTTPFGSFYQVAMCVAVQTDGKIVVAGSSGNGFNDNAFAILRLCGDNRDPIPLPAPFALTEDSSLTVSTPSYYYDLDNDVVTTSLLSGPAHGTVSLNPYGQFTYTPFANFSGADSFSYRLADSFGGESVGSVAFVVNPLNDNPIANGDVASVPEDSGPTAIDVLVNDNTSPDSGETLTITGVTNGTNGTVAITGGGAGLTYQPAGDFNGTDAFTYTISDGNGGTATATVVVGVIPVNDDPTARNDKHTMLENQIAAPINVLANDSSAPDSSELLTITSVTQGLNGTVAIINSGAALTYLPPTNFIGTDTFTYTISDGNGGIATGTVTVTVDQDITHYPPDAINDSGITIPAGGASIIDVLANDNTDIEGDQKFIIAVSQGEHGLVTITSDFASVIYTPASNFVGTDTFTYVITDVYGGTDTATVDITVSPSITFQLATSSGSELLKSMKIIVTRTPVQFGINTVNYAITGGTATQGTDFTLLGTGTLTFKPGKTTAKIKLKIVNDLVNEGTETVILGLSNASGGLLIGPNAQHTFTIIDNDGAAAAREAFALDALFGSAWEWNSRSKRMGVSR